MKIDVPFCTCPDTECPNHPVNHDQGCTLCIAKNLKLGEIPNCFFLKAAPDFEGPTFFMEDFAKAVLNSKKEK